MKRTRILAVILTAVMLLAVMPFSAVSAAGNVWDGTVADGFASGSGTEDDPYVITNGAELALLKDFDSTDLYFVLGNDILLSDTSAANWYENAIEWPYIEFYGNFDGKGYTISGMCVNPETLNEEYENVGLFSYAECATVTNLNIADAYLVGIEDVGSIIGDGGDCSIYNCTFDGIIKSLSYEYTDESGETHPAGGGYAGGIIGYAWSSEDGGGFIEGCINYGDVYTDSYNAGGISSLVSGSIVIAECENYGNVCGSSYVGGIVGEAGGGYYEDDNSGELVYDSPSVVSCVNKGAVSVNYEESYYIGGIVGYAYISQILDCYNFSDIYAGVEAGGIVGYASSKNSIGYCANYGEISGISNIGGILGYGDGSTYDLSDGTVETLSIAVILSVNHGDVVGYSDLENDIRAVKFGGIAGRVDYGNFVSCYNYGDVSSYEASGGIVGYLESESAIYACYNNASIAVEDCYAGGMVGDIEGYSNDVLIIGSTNKGHISGEFDIGGIMGYGYVNDGNTITVAGSQNKGIIEGECCIGGLGGYVDGGVILDCLSDGHIIVNEYNVDYNCPCGGGLFGESENISITNCVSSGTVELCEGASFGGLVNLEYDIPVVENSYYLDILAELGIIKDNNGDYTSDSEGVNAVSASEMKNQSTFVDFNFESVWTMGSENPELVDAAKSILGDVNDDGEVDKKDYAIVKRYCFGTVEFELGQNLAADVNGDGEVDKKDYALIKRACFGTAEIK